MRGIENLNQYFSTTELSLHANQRFLNAGAFNRNSKQIETRTINKLDSMIPLIFSLIAIIQLW